MFSHYDRNNNGNLEREELEQVIFLYFNLSVINLFHDCRYFLSYLYSSRRTKI